MLDQKMMKLFSTLFEETYLMLQTTIFSQHTRYLHNTHMEVYISCDSCGICDSSPWRTSNCESGIVVWLCRSCVTLYMPAYRSPRLWTQQGIEHRTFQLQESTVGVLGEVGVIRRQERKTRGAALRDEAGREAGVGGACPRGPLIKEWLIRRSARLPQQSVSTMRFPGEKRGRVSQVCTGGEAISRPD